LVIGLEIDRKMKIKHLVVYGDVELIVNSLKNEENLSSQTSKDESIQKLCMGCN
jgi:hypothetical protein